uniref:Vespid chemotactic peptide 5f n=1 Tax=Vespa magnifica TaxID=202807 RepID=CRBLF_VESMG|nr:RecName: Full=Vespid chemotactic peptide 5f; Short=VCP 5f [Vespa magnifica]
FLPIPRPILLGLL